MKKVLKWTLRIVIAVILLFVILGFAMMMIGGKKANKTYAVDGLLTTVHADSMSLARGEHLTKVFGCVGCHGDNLAGSVLFDAPPFTIAPPNITPGNGSAVANYSVEDWDRAIRHGVKPDGTGILIMPARGYNNMSDSDVSALIAYLRTIPPVDNDIAPSKLKGLGKIILATGAPFYESTTKESNRIMPEIGPTAEYGDYFATTLCKTCHGANLEGGPGVEPGIPAPSLDSASKWDVDAFANTLRTGVRPNGDTLSEGSMPPSILGHFNDIEMQAIHSYLRTVFE